MEVESISNNAQMMLAETVFAEGENCLSEGLPAPTMDNNVSTEIDPASTITDTTNTGNDNNSSGSDSFAHNLEDHQVVLKEKGSPTNATKVFREHVCAAFPRSRVFDIEQMKALQDMYYKCKFGNLYPPNTPIPSVTFWVSYDKSLRHEQWVSSENKEDLRFSKDNDMAFVRASEECLRDYVRNVGGRSPQDRRQRKRLKQDTIDTSAAVSPEDSSSDIQQQVLTPALREATSSSTTTTTTTTTTGLSLSPLTITTPPKVFQLVGLENLRQKATDILQKWKASSSGYEAMMKEMHILQFWKDFDKYETLLRQHPLEASSSLDDYQRGRQTVHEGMLVDIVNSLGNAMVDWYNADYLTRMNAMSFPSNQNENNNNNNNNNNNHNSGSGPSSPHGGGNSNGGSGGNTPSGGHPFGSTGTGTFQFQGYDSAFFPRGSLQYAISHLQGSEDSESYYSSDYDDESWSGSDAESDFSSFVSDGDDATSLTYPSSEETGSERDTDEEGDDNMVMIKVNGEQTPEPRLLRGPLLERMNDDAGPEESKEEDSSRFDDDEEEEDIDDSDILFDEIRSEATALSDICANYLYQQQQDGGGGGGGGGGSKGTTFCMDEMYMQQCRAELLKIRFQRLRHYSFDPGCSASYSKLSNVAYGRTSYNSWLQTVSDPDMKMLENDMADLCRLGVPQRMVRTS